MGHNSLSLYSRLRSPDSRLSSVSPPGIEPGLRPSHGRVLIQHTPRTRQVVGSSAKTGERRASAFLRTPDSALPSTSSTPPRNRTSSGRFEVCHAVHHTRRASLFTVARPGIEPGPTASGAVMLSGTTTGHRQYPDLDSNQDQDLRRVLCCPLHHRDARADDWIRTSIIRFTRPAPYSVEPRRQKQECKESNSARRFWRPLASQKHTPVNRL